MCGSQSAGSTGDSHVPSKIRAAVPGEMGGDGGGVSKGDWDLSDRESGEANRV